MEIPLYYSVLLFVIPAIYGQNLWIGPALTALIPIAVINHAKFDTEYVGKDLIIAIDRIGSHLFAGILLYDVIRNAPYTDHLSLIVFLSATIYAIYTFHYLKPNVTCPSTKKLIHASMHFVSSIGISSAIALLSSKP